MSNEIGPVQPDRQYITLTAVGLGVGLLEALQAFLGEQATAGNLLAYSIDLRSEYGTPSPHTSVPEKVYYRISEYNDDDAETEEQP